MILTQDAVKGTYSNPAVETKDIQKYLPLVKRIASKFNFNLPPDTDYEDLVSVGMIGLMEAMNRYDETKGASFETYARYRIRGSILNYLDSISWVPRSVREKNKEFEKASEKLSEKLGRLPDEGELMEELNMDWEEYEENLKSMAKISVIPIEELNEELKFAGNLYDFGPEESFEKNLKVKIVSEAVESLKEKEKIVVSLYFYEDLTLKEIGEVLGVSESRVSQILSSAITRIRGYLRSKL
ncbi:MAG: sigma-70 family RNA polymerase sigma factor [Elusimicrobiales bacterium]